MGKAAARAYKNLAIIKYKKPEIRMRLKQI
jgi:hypothetical protein